MKTVQFKHPPSSEEIESLCFSISSEKRYRIAILGCTGSGKTSLAKIMAKNLDLSHIEMDKLVWKSIKGGAIDANYFEKMNQAMSCERFIIEGHWKRVESSVSDKIDLIIELKLPRKLILKRLLKRDLIEFAQGKRITSDFIYYLKNY